MNAQDWADHLVAGIDPHVCKALADNPKGAIEEHFELKLRATSAAPSRGNRGTCDGLSILDQDKILYKHTPDSRRENFTMLHELGHHLAHRSDELLIWAADQKDSDRVIEEICDRFAAAILLPPDLLDKVIQDQKPAALHILSLFQLSNASREVCAIGVSKRLGCEGFVAVIKRTEWKVTFAARRADTRPYPWRDDDVPIDHPLRALGAKSKLRREAWWPFPDGENREFYMDAISDDGYIYAILSDIDLWGITAFHALEPVDRKTSTLTLSVHCRPCGFDGITHQFPCPDCKKPYCPKCGKCECDRQGEKMARCSMCFLLVPTRRLVNGVCNDCQRRKPSRR